MSFIFGIVNFDQKAVSREEIRLLGNGVKWENFIVHTEGYGNVALGYCHHPQRQPKAGLFHGEDLLVLGDIRIYNNEELGKIFDYASPEEAFAKAYRLWGTDFANHINGDFAALIFDRCSEQAHLIRDHIGARPLSYRFDEHKLIFASHEFGLVKSGLFRTDLSEKKLINRFFSQGEMYKQTVFKQVLKVVPGHGVSFAADGSHTVRKYWNPENILKNKSLTFEVAAARLRELLVTATQNRMVQGKTGLHISGGLDSCGVAAIVADHTPDKSCLCGYSWTPEVFKETVEGTDEKEFIAAFCEDKQVGINYLNLQENETVKNALLPEFETQHIEHPVMQMAGKDGVAVIFSGWGGDEFVSLSTRGTVNHLFFSFKWFTLLQYVRKKGITSTLCQFRTEILPLLVPFGLLPAYRIGQTDWSILHLLKPAFIRKYWRKLFFHRYKNAFGYGDRSRFMLNLLEHYHLPERMDSWSINAERYGFEYKYPLLDKDVLEFWFSIPVEHTYKDFHPRLLYREAMKGILTEKIRTRRDKGEALRIAFSMRERQNGKKYLENLFYGIPLAEHLHFFKPEAFQQVFNEFPSEKLLKNIRNMHKITCYLRYVALVKDYLTTNHE